ncbi:thiolase family protein [Desulfatiglans anilini]|uniref:thiolase family protein n=1 Tax=Desulfatiglans anilini TaxID=90728 RepID=UPI00041ABC70|nr:acetyl-CoA C-acyltransferase [Desulfatiglans anilini]
MEEVVICSAVRTPIGNFLGKLSGVSCTELGAIVINGAIERAGISKNAVDEVVMGNVLPCGLGQNPCRQAMIKAGNLSFDVGALTVNKVCGSGLKAIMLLVQGIQAGDARVGVGGGMESMSQAPYYLDKARTGYRMGVGVIADHMVHDGLWDVVNDFHMGYTAEIISEKFKVSKEEMDQWAFDSNMKAINAWDEGKFSEEVIPVKVTGRNGMTITIDRDEGPRVPDLSEIRHLRPAFKKDGLVTAGNSSKISDGAAALLVMGRRQAEELGCSIMATITAQAAGGLGLEDVLMSPIKAIPKALSKAGLKIDDIDIFEINEAFAASTVGVMKELGINPEKVNVHGGAVALGHPIGASGARVLTTLLYAMKDMKARRGVASLCLGGGEAVALVVEM